MDVEPAPARGAPPRALATVAVAVAVLVALLAGFALMTRNYLAGHLVTLAPSGTLRATVTEGDWFGVAITGLSGIGGRWASASGLTIAWSDDRPGSAVRAPVTPTWGQRVDYRRGEVDKPFTVDGGFIVPAPAGDRTTTLHGRIVGGVTYLRMGRAGFAEETTALSLPVQLTVAPKRAAAWSSGMTAVTGLAWLCAAVAGLLAAAALGALGRAVQGRVRGPRQRRRGPSGPGGALAVGLLVVIAGGGALLAVRGILDWADVPLVDTAGPTVGTASSACSWAVAVAAAAGAAAALVRPQRRRSRLP